MGDGVTYSFLQDLLVLCLLQKSFLCRWFGGLDGCWTTSELLSPAGEEGRGHDIGEKSVEEGRHPDPKMKRGCTVQTVFIAVK